MESWSEPKGGLSEVKTMMENTEFLEGRPPLPEEEQPATASALLQLADERRGEGSDEEAEELYAAAIDELRESFGEEHPNTLFAMHKLATLYRALGRPGDAAPLLQRIASARR